jgi:predicted PhzF superfamily epimerase YddE/YHI9
VRSEQRFFLVDVVADEPLTGNPLAVVPDADALTDRQMRAVGTGSRLPWTSYPRSDSVLDKKRERSPVRPREARKEACP